MNIDNNWQRIGSIRNRILFFSILVTLVPSIGMGWFWYDISRKTTSAKIEQQLTSSANIIEREIGLWFKERNYDLQVFSNSFVVSENLGIYHREKASSAGPSQKTDEALKKISTYLGIIITKFQYYQHLAVLNREGKVLASSSPERPERFTTLPDNLQVQLQRNQYFIGNSSSTAPEGGPQVLIGIPLIENTENAVIGFFVLEAHLDTIQNLIASSLPVGRMQSGSAVTLLEKDGRIIFSTTSNDSADTAGFVTKEALKICQNPGSLHEYVNRRQTQVLGMGFSLTELPWYLLMEKNRSDVYAALTEARNRILLITILLTVAIGGTAVIIARNIIYPLQDLIKGVQQVAGGDLQVTVPVRRKDELGIVTSMFNEMVERLQEHQTRLEELATTDPLTGLANRKQIMTSLELQMEGFSRHGTNFSLLMLDIDFFKKVNDTYGHQAGDSVLVELASILSTILRTLDTAGRYGGEEFVVILHTADQAQAGQSAERIRQAVERHVFACHGHELRITVSIGASVIYPTDETVDSLIARVDKALYMAKSEGRNRVCVPNAPATIKDGAQGPV
jgi:diguanylate cyclase (GGDEF)-like protein